MNPQLGNYLFLQEQHFTSKTVACSSFLKMKICLVTCDMLQFMMYLQVVNCWLAGARWWAFIWHFKDETINA